MKVHKPELINMNKLNANFKGPYRVTKVNDNGLTYQLLDEQTDEIYRAHHSKLWFHKLTPKYVLQHPLYIELTNGIYVCNEPYLVDDNYNVSSSDSMESASVDVSLNSKSSTMTNTDQTDAGEVILTMVLALMIGLCRVVRNHYSLGLIVYWFDRL